MTGEINLDEIVGELEPKKVIIGGETFWANPDPSLGVLYDMYKLGAGFDAETISDTDAAAMMEGVKAILTEIFGDEGAVVFQKCGMQKVMVLLAALMEGYSAEGKASGPSRSSRRAGARSKQTSGASTRSTSAKRASAKNGSAAAISHA